MNKKNLSETVKRIATLMSDNEQYLISLDQQNGDGDLGLYMKTGFTALDEYLDSCIENDLGRLLMSSSRVFNENAPSSLGTIISIGMMGMAKTLKGKTECTVEELASAMSDGLEKIKQKTGTKVGEKTVVDALEPAIVTLKESGSFSDAAKAASEGSESTKMMLAVHGRAAYYKEKSIGVLDGGSVVGKIIFEAMVK